MIETNSKGKAKMDDVTICIPFIRQDYVLDCLRSLKKYVTSVTYKTVCVNQTLPNREFEDALYELSDVVIRPHVNWGFAQSVNMAMRLAPTPWICALNDDVAFTNDPFPGIFETFQKFETAAAVCPQSFKEPGWGWGEPGYRYLIPQAYLTGDLKELYDEDRLRMKKAKDAKALWEGSHEHFTANQEETLRGQLDTVYAEFEETQGQLETLVFALAHDPAFIAALIEEKNWQVVDGFACFFPVFRADALTEVGMFDERFSAGGDDYDALSRYYKAGYRMLSTSHSFVWHWWSKSKDSPDGYDTALPRARPPWNKLSTKGFGSDGLYSPDVDCWGRSDTRTDPVVYQAPL
jgi:GT2 family glycosyltransferase